jgi:DNA-binding MarR family transcriptional regulator
VSTPSSKNVIKAQLQTFSVANYIHQSITASSFGLHPTDMLAIHYLDQNGKMMTGQLGNALGLTSGATTAAIDRLLKTGFVTRESHSKDRRRVYVRLDQTGVKKLKAKYHSVDQKIEEVLDHYSEKELQTISKFLETLFTAN